MALRNWSETVRLFGANNKSKKTEERRRGNPACSPQSLLVLSRSPLKHKLNSLYIGIHPSLFIRAVFLKMFLYHLRASRAIPQNCVTNKYHQNAFQNKKNIYKEIQIIFCLFGVGGKRGLRDFLSLSSPNKIELQSGDNEPRREKKRKKTSGTTALTLLFIPL